MLMGMESHFSVSSLIASVRKDLFYGLEAQSSQPNLAYLDRQTLSFPFIEAELAGNVSLNYADVVLFFLGELLNNKCFSS